MSPKRIFYKEGMTNESPNNIILNDVSTSEKPQASPRIPPKYSGIRRSYTIPEKLYKLAPSEVNNVVHGVFSGFDGPDPFIPSKNPF